MPRFRDPYNTIINLRGKEPNGPFTVALFSRLFLLDQQRLCVEMPSGIIQRYYYSRARNGGYRYPDVSRRTVMRKENLLHLMRNGNGNTRIFQ